MVVVGEIGGQAAREELRAASPDLAPARGAERLHAPRSPVLPPALPRANAGRH